MKILKVTGIVLLGIIFLVVIVSLFLPASSHVERSIVIRSESSVPFALINNLKEWYQWSPWHKLDTNMTIVYGDIPEGEGSWYSWKSDKDEVGEGKLMIVKSTPGEYIETRMEFSGMGTSKGSYTFEKVPEGVKLTWAMDNDGHDMPALMKVPSKYFNLFIDKLVGPDFEKGLNNLKIVSEATPVVERVAGFETEEREFHPMIVAGIRETINTQELTSKTFSKWYGQITKVLQKNSITPVGSPMAFYYQYGPKEVEVEAAIPVAVAGTDAGKVKFHETAAIKAFVVKYRGDYNKVADVYSQTYAYLKEKGKFSTGAPMEIYVTDPGMEHDTAKWYTEIVFPLD